MTLPEQPEIAIIGSGLAGLTLSIGLARHGIPHRIYETASAFSEIGAGIALGPNSITALELIDPKIGEALQKCITYNEGVDEKGEGKTRQEWMDIRVGVEDGFNTLITTIRHTSSPKPGRACFHRAKFLDELIKLIPPSTTTFGKSLTSITDDHSTGELSLNFADGSNSTASVVLACDGIKSVVREQYVLSDAQDQRIRRPVFANEFAYRGMFSRAQFQDITRGTIDTGKGTIFCGPDSYVVMYPVEKGSLMNVVAIKNIPPPTPDSEFRTLLHETNWIQPVTSETMLSDFAGWGMPIKALLSHIQRPERWALYDHLPASTYIKGRVALIGDAAHATTPHQGQGAGMAFEDSFILSSILGQVLNEPQPSSFDIDKRLQACLFAYDCVRRPRTSKVTCTSREMGKILGFAGDEVGSDLAKMKANLDSRMNWIWDVDLLMEVRRAAEIAREEVKRATPF